MTATIGHVVSGWASPVFPIHPGLGLPELPAVPELPSLENVLPSLNAVVKREGQIQQRDAKERAVQGQVQQLDQTSQVPSISGTNGAVVSLDQSRQTSNSPEGLSRGTGWWWAWTSPKCAAP